MSFILSQQVELQQDDNDLKDVEIEYIVKPMDVSSLKTMDGMANLEEDMLNQFSDIFRHFQKGKEEDDEVSILTKNPLLLFLTSLSRTLK